MNVTPAADIVADTLTTTEDNAVTANVITGTNGASADNFDNLGAMLIRMLVLAANGSVTSASDGTVTYTPNSNYFGPDSFTYTVTSGGVTETTTVTVNVRAVADTPSVTDATTTVNTQTTSGLVITANPGDLASVTHFQITNITNGVLFLNDGITPVPVNSFITVAQGNAG